MDCKLCTFLLDATFRGQGWMFTPLQSFVGIQGDTSKVLCKLKCLELEHFPAILCLSP